MGNTNHDARRETKKEHSKPWKYGEEKSTNLKFYNQQIHLLKNKPLVLNTTKLKELVWQITLVVILDLRTLV